MVTGPAVPAGIVIVTDVGVCTQAVVANRVDPTSIARIFDKNEPLITTELPPTVVPVVGETPLIEDVCEGSGAEAGAGVEAAGAL